MNIHGKFQRDICYRLKKNEAEKKHVERSV